MTDVELVRLLKETSLFSSLSKNELLSLKKKLYMRSFKKNETILYEKDTNEYMYLILDGQVKVVQINEDGKEIILAIHQAGDFFGEISMIDGRTMPATVISSGHSEIAIISKKEFQSLLTMHSKINENLLKILCARLRESWNKIQILSFNTSSQRVRMLFHSLIREHGERIDGGIQLNIKLTHLDIANMTGLTRETVTRIIDKWQKEREIILGRKRFIVLSDNFLQKELKR